MRKMGKIMCLVIALTMMMTVVSASAAGNEASVGGAEYATLQDAVNAAAAGDEITLLSDVICSSKIVIDKAVTLNIGSHTLHFDVTSGTGIEASADLTVKGTGTITSADRTSSSPVQTAYVISQSKGDLTIEGVTIKPGTTTTSSSTASRTTAVRFYSSGSLTISNAKVYGGSNNGHGSDGGDAIWVAGSGTTTITNSELHGGDSDSDQSRCGDGGDGLWNQGNGTVVITDSTVTGGYAKSASSSASGFSGGKGVWNQNQGKIVLNDTNVTGGNATSSYQYDSRTTGGAAVWNQGNGSAVEVAGGSITGGSVDNWGIGGWAIWQQNAGTVEADGAKLTGGSASGNNGQGGTAINLQTGKVNVTIANGTTVSGGDAASSSKRPGSGISMGAVSSGEVSISASTITAGNGTYASTIGPFGIEIPRGNNENLKLTTENTKILGGENALALSVPQAAVENGNIKFTNTLLDGGIMIGKTSGGYVFDDDEGADQLLSMMAATNEDEWRDEDGKVHYEFAHRITFKPGKYADPVQDDVVIHMPIDSKVTLEDAIFNREGYVQVAWSTTDGGEKGYDLSSEYDKNEDLVLYPVWEELQPVDTTTPTTAPTATPVPTAVPTLTIITHPQNQNVVEGQTATFSVKVKGDSVTYKWFINRNDGKGFVYITGATSDSYTTSAATVDNDGYKYKCVAADGYGNTVESNIAALSVEKAPEMPKTGDKSMPWLWTVVCIAALGGVVFITLRKKNDA